MGSSSHSFAVADWDVVVSRIGRKGQYRAVARRYGEMVVTPRVGGKGAMLHARCRIIQILSQRSDFDLSAYNNTKSG